MINRKEYGKRSIIDIGSNNIYLLLGTISGDNVTVVKRHTGVTALSEGMRDGFLTLDAMDRTIIILRSFISEAIDYSKDIIITGTSCSRDAKNKEYLIQEIWKNFHIHYRILSAMEESYLTFYATQRSFQDIQNFVSFDIGGGSTELSIYNAGKLQNLVSIDLGLRRFQNKYSNDLQAIEKYINDALDHTNFTIPLMENWIGIGLSVGNLTNLKFHYRSYNHDSIHGKHVSKSDLIYLRNMIDKITDAELQELLPYEPQNKYVVLSSIIYILILMERFHFNEFIVSNNNLTYGLLSLNEDLWMHIKSNKLDIEAINAN
ncbi:MAG TPA: hypothetical protein PLE74_08290 [Candidatus Cloacimonadota bacterium]|nr:hypothetical protein [Candidatus Cloacimonadota bacterium]